MQPKKPRKTYPAYIPVEVRALIAKISTESSLKDTRSPAIKQVYYKGVYFGDVQLIKEKWVFCFDGRERKYSSLDRAKFSMVRANLVKYPDYYVNRARIIENASNYSGVR